MKWIEQEHTNRVVGTKAKTQSENLVKVEWVCIHDSNIHLPFLEVVCLDEFDAGWELLLGLGYVRRRDSSGTSDRMQRLSQVYEEG